MFSCKFYEIFKNTFFLEAIGATAPETSSQAVCLDIVIKTSKWHQLRQYFHYIANFENAFCLLR